MSCCASRSRASVTVLLTDPQELPAPPPSPSSTCHLSTADAEAAPDAPAAGSGYSSATDAGAPPPYTPGPLDAPSRALALAAVAALLTTLVEERIPRDCTLIRVVSRGGSLGVDEKVEWRLSEQPPLPIRTGMRLALFTPRGQYRGVARTVGPLVGLDRHWVTFLLSPGRSAPATAQTLSVPVAHARLPWFVRLLRAVLASHLPDEHPTCRLPLSTPDPLSAVTR